jgi:hypothetical protein
MSKEIIVRDVHIPTVSRMQKVLFSALMKNFTKTKIEAFISAGIIFRVLSENSEIRLIFQNKEVKIYFFGQLNADEKVLFEKLEKTRIFVEI